MAEEEIKVKVTAEGVQETAKQFDQLTASMQRSQRVQEMIARTSGDIQRRNVIDVIKQQAAAVNGLTDTMSRNEKAAAAVNAQIRTFRQGLGPAAALIGTLGSAFSQLAPQATGAMGAVQKFVSAMSQAMALAGTGGAVAGPWGAVAGGVVGLISGIATSMGQAKQEADALAKATADNAKALGDYLDQIGRLRGAVGAKYDQKKAETDLQKELLSGKASAETLEKAILVEQGKLENPYYRDRYLDAARAGRKHGPAAGEKLLAQRDAEAAYIRNQIAAYQSRLKEAREQARAAGEIEQGKFEVEADITAAGGLPETPRAGPSRIEKDLQRIAAARRPNVAGEYVMDQFAGEHPTAELELNRQQRLEDQRKNDLELFKRTAEQQERIIKKRNDREVQLEKQKKDALARIREQETGAQLAAAQMVTGAALKGISEVIKGKKLELGAILESLGDQFVAAGTGLIFTGLGISANPFTPGAGAGMVEIGAAEVAFGLGLGAVGANAPGGSNYGGGSAAAATGAGLPGGANDPYRNSFAPPQQSGPTIININFPTVLSPSAIDGARIESARRQAKRVYG